jgi:hypothetical protein
VEGANGIGRPLAQRLLASGERVLDVPAKLAARARVFDTGQGRKTDPADAHAIGCRMEYACQTCAYFRTGTRITAGTWVSWWWFRSTVVTVCARVRADPAAGSSPAAPAPQEQGRCRHETGDDPRVRAHP